MKYSVVARYLSLDNTVEEYGVLEETEGGYDSQDDFVCVVDYSPSDFW